MLKISTDQIVALLRCHPEGLLAIEVCNHFAMTKTGLSSRLSKLAAYNIIQVKSVSKSVRPDGKTTPALIRKYFPPLALVPAI